MDIASYRRLRIEQHDHGVVLLTLSNPGKLNATDAVLHAELARVFHDIGNDEAIRAVVVTGEGTAFSAGGDLDWIADQVGNHAQTMRVMKEAGDIVRTMIDCDTPIISAINGVAVGAGLAVALLADISIIDESTRFTDGHIRLGVGAGDHAVAIWPLLCGMAKAKYYLLTADFIDGREAERIGLVSKAVPAAEVLPTAMAIATKLARGPRDATRLTKRALNHWLRQALPNFEASLAYEMLNFLGADAAEGLAALQEKRAPEFPAVNVLDGVDLAAELALAHELADIAESIAKPHYDRRSFHLDWKLGGEVTRSEVTEADRDSEAAISARLLRDRPNHGLFGEEHGLVGDTDSPWRWIVDPIDGTSNFVRGIPIWACLVALTHVDHGPVVGVVAAPALQRRWWGALGHGAHMRTPEGEVRPLRVSSVATLDEAQVSVTFSSGWDDLGLTPMLVQLQQQAYRARGFGDFWQHMLVAEGAIDVAVDAVGLQPYDLAAVMIVVEEAGGRFTDRLGERTHLNDTAVSSNGLLHDRVVPLA